MKECFKCKVKRPLDEFYIHKGMVDGHLGKCKECCKKDVRINYRVRYDHYRKYEERRNKTPERIAAYIAKQKADLMRWPEKVKARKAIQYAVRKGQVAKQPCEVCGDSLVDAHHTDYSKPLEVHWLCRTHHRRVHSGLISLTQ